MGSETKIQWTAKLFFDSATQYNKTSQPGVISTEAGSNQSSLLSKGNIMAEYQPTPANTRRQTGANNPNWHGGRVIASNGYVLIRVGTGHHLSDVRGYAYEHRLVAEEKIGRQLLPNELVHHKDENKQNNSPDNLEVVTGNAEHFVHHRGEDCNLKMPGEVNPTIHCACGCGEAIAKFDDAGRPRRFITGHNSPRHREAAILAVMPIGVPVRLIVIAEKSGRSKTGAQQCLASMITRGLVSKVQFGIYQRVS